MPPKPPLLMTRIVCWVAAVGNGPRRCASKTSRSEVVFDRGATSEQTGSGARVLGDRAQRPAQIGGQHYKNKSTWRLCRKQATGISVLAGPEIGRFGSTADRIAREAVRIGAQLHGRWRRAATMRPWLATVREMRPAASRPAAKAAGDGGGDGCRVMGENRHGYGRTSKHRDAPTSPRTSMRRFTLMKRDNASSPCPAVRRRGARQAARRRYGPVVVASECPVRPADLAFRPCRISSPLASSPKSGSHPLR